jgi:hypothetical protein
MTDRTGQRTDDPAPDSLQEAAEIVREDPALSGDAGGDSATDDDARTSDTAHSGEVRDS